MLIFAIEIVTEVLCHLKTFVMRSASRFLLPVLLLAAACGKDSLGPSADGPDSRDILIPASRVPLFGDLSDYELLPDATGTRSDGPSVTLASLLDASGTRTLRFGDVEFSQTPFLQNREEVLAAFGDGLAPDAGSATSVRKYLLETVQDGARHRYVVTMVATAAYAERYPAFDYLDMPDYSGAVLLSTPDGKVFRAELYRNGLLREAELLRKDEVPEGGDLHYVILYRRATRAGEEPELGGAVCLAEKPAGNKAEGNPLLLYHPQYTVSLSTNLPDYIDLEGGGTYTSGSWTTVGCFPHYVLLTLEFGRWTGTFLGERRTSFPWKVARDVTATAYFEDRGPCMDLERGVVNPLKQMYVAATASGSYVNGTYKALRGWYEDGSPRYHWGVDLAAKEGTPVYSMYSGRIVRIESDHPDAYEEGSFGNVIVTENDVEGYDRKVYLQYAHLQYARPVAVNPRSGRPFAKGDAVFAGDLIGYTGRTGNAYRDADVPNKHLDLMAAFDVDPASGRIKTGVPTDPAPFLNGTLDLEQLQKRKGKIGGIRCD